MFKKYFGFTFILYLIMAVLLISMVDAKKVKLRRLNALLANAAYPLSLNEGGDNVDQAKLYTSLTYYKILADLYPQLAQADEMVGYCYFYLKDYDHSQRWLEKAIKIHPERIWVTYNLGVVAYKKGEIQRSMHYFQDIINGDPQAQMSGAALSALSTLSPEGRQKLLMLIPYFIHDLRVKSAYQSVQQNGSLVFHPWWHLFSPGQESLF